MYAAPIDTLLASHPGCTPTSCYISVTAVAKPDAGEWRQAGAGEVSEGQLWLVPLKDIDFPDPGLRLSNFQVGAAATAATVAAPAPGAAAVAASGLPARALLADEDEDEDEEEEDDADDSEQGDAKAETQADKQHKKAGGSTAHGATDSSKKTFPRASRTFRSRFSSGAPKPPVPVASQKPAKNLRERLHGGSAPEPSMVPSKVVLPAGTPLSFTLSAQRPAALTQFLTNYRGRFSDDAFTAVHPCQPRTITFYPHVSAGPITAEELAADLKVESLFDHQYGKPAAARKVQGGGGVVQVPTVASAPTQLPMAAVKKVPAKAAAVSTANILAVEKKRHAPN